MPSKMDQERVGTDEGTQCHGSWSGLLKILRWDAASLGANQADVLEYQIECAKRVGRIPVCCE